MKVLEAMIAAGGGGFRGIRFITASDPDQAAWGLDGHPAGGPLDRDPLTYAPPTPALHADIHRAFGAQIYPGAS